jgi:hypothetical protein
LRSGHALIARDELAFDLHRPLLVPGCLRLEGLDFSPSGVDDLLRGASGVARQLELSLELGRAPAALRLDLINSPLDVGARTLAFSGASLGRLPSLERRCQTRLEYALHIGLLRNAGLGCASALFGSSKRLLTLPHELVGARNAGLRPFELGAETPSLCLMGLECRGRSFLSFHPPIPLALKATLQLRDRLLPSLGPAFSFVAQPPFTEDL